VANVDRVGDFAGAGVEQESVEDRRAEQYIENVEKKKGKYEDELMKELVR
jgi:hypothetical protein